MLRREMVRLLVRREASLLNVAAIFSRGAGDDCSNVRVAPRKFRLVAEGQSKQVVNHQDLTVAIRSSAYANRGDLQLGRDSRRKLPGNRFQNDGERAGGFHSACIARNPPNVLTDCGVRPMCPITGISASTNRAIKSMRRSPPSILTASAPASFTKRTACRTPSIGSSW